MTIINLLTQPSVFYLILLPLIGVFVILFYNGNKNISFEWLPSHWLGRIQTVEKRFISVKNNTGTVLYNIALFFSLFNLLVSVVMWYFLTILLLHLRRISCKIMLNT